LPSTHVEGLPRAHADDRYPQAGRSKRPIFHEIAVYVLYGPSSSINNGK
jgi:hypothetical protein